MTKGFATIAPECEEVFDEVKGTDNLNFVIYAASAHDKKITVAESGKYKDYDEFLSHFKEDTPRYAVVKLTYDSPVGDGQRSKLAFITWYERHPVLHQPGHLRDDLLLVQ
jgi:cofilin